MNAYRRDRVRELLRIAASLPVSLRECAERIRDGRATSRDAKIIGEFVIRLIDEVGETDDVIQLKNVKETHV